MMRLNIMIMAMFALVLVSCEKELDFSYRDIDPIPVIEGVLTEDGCRVTITLTTPMDEPMDQKHVTDAVVMLKDLSAEIETLLTPDGEGCFVCEAGGIPGRKYLLSVEYDGNAYESGTEMLPSVEVTAVEFEWVKMPYDYVAVLQVSFRDDPFEADERYWVRVYRNGEPYKWLTASDGGITDGVLDVAMLTSRKDLDEEDEEDALHDGDIVTVSVSAIDKDMCGYLDALMAGGSNGLPQFSGGECLGYFQASTPGEMSVVFEAE